MREVWVDGVEAKDLRRKKGWAGGWKVFACAAAGWKGSNHGSRSNQTTTTTIIVQIADGGGKSGIFFPTRDCGTDSSSCGPAQMRNEQL